ncbi:MAG: hypothetical protein A4S09_14410 [Proteobacteria bacterium SG_bin7]|nr:MAG: hypothetical protein A4S09_14410 [Proteobacteria bacterium SG_bin7]
MSSINPSTDPKKSRLGRGLGSLLGENIAPTTSPIATTLTNPAPHQKIEVAVLPKSPEAPAQVHIDLLYANPNQPRREFNTEKLSELSASIKVHGIIQPILVMPDRMGKYQIVAGERRWRAARMAGLNQVPVVAKEQDEQKSLELAIIENIQRHDLNPLEEAKAYQQLIKKFNFTQNDVADRVGKERATVANILRVLTLELEIQELLSAGKITLGHAKVLLGVENKIIQRKLARKIINDNLSVRALEKLVAKGADLENEANEAPKKEDIHTKAICENLQKSLGTKVDIDYNSGKGQINISFYTDEQLSEIVRKISRL